MRVELSERAAADIEDIIGYTVENFGEAQADEYTLGLYHSFQLLEDNPRIGRSFPNITVRRYVYRMHHVYYEIRDEVIRVAHIRHASQDLPEWWPEA